MKPQDEPIMLHEYFRNNYFKNLIACSLILMFSIVFYLIYLVVDSIIDKNKHYKLALRIHSKYEASKAKRDTQENNLEQHILNYELKKDDLAENNGKLEFSIWSYRNLQISFIHSVLCSLWIIKIVIFSHNELFGDLLFYVSWDTYLLVAFSSGYFLYDFYDIYANHFCKIEWVVCAHHVIVLVSFTYHMTHLLSIGYTVCALFMEFNSVFLHARKLLKFYGFKQNDLIVRGNQILNMLTFIFFRFGVLIQIFTALYHDGHRVNLFYFIMLSTCAVLMAIINIVLFKRLLIKDFCTRPANTDVETSENEETNINLLNIECKNNDLIKIQNHPINSTN